MAAVHNRKDGTKRIGFTGPDRRRRTLYLGRTSKRTAEEVKGKVERLNAANVAGHAPDDATARWVAGLDDVMHTKLAKLGLVSARQSATVGGFFPQYAESRAVEVKPATLTHLRKAASDLTKFYGADTPLRDVTAGDADDYRRHLTARGLNVNTTRRRVGRAKQFFNAAVRKELIDRNPFADQKCQVRGNPDKRRFVTLAEADAILDACPDAQWRLIFALCRFGGLRCPSELLPLTWGDVDWERNRLTVTSPKTEHHEGGASRVLPIFPELRPHLEAAFDAADEGERYVVTRYRDPSQNMRTTFGKIIRRAGVAPWPKPFHNLRATRQTELMATYPNHVVCEWIGNSAAVAKEHYLTVTDDDLERGAADRTPEARNARCNARPTHPATRHGAAPGRTGEPDDAGDLTTVAPTPAGAADRRPLPAALNPRQGLEP